MFQPVIDLNTDTIYTGGGQLNIHAKKFDLKNNFYTGAGGGGLFKWPSMILYKVHASKLNFYKQERFLGKYSVLFIYYIYSLMIKVLLWA